MSTDQSVPDNPFVIRLLTPADARELGRLFSDLAEDPDSRHFHPHPLTADHAVALASRLPAMRDRYFGAIQGRRLIGYGMLRGWDDGYSVPSFGVAVSPDARGSGIGRMLLRYAIALAREMGAETMMLKVHGDNPHARRLYESEGFVFDTRPMSDGQLKGVLGL